VLAGEGAARACAVPMVEAMTALVLVDLALRQQGQCG
jgi:chorismate synthase